MRLWLGIASLLFLVHGAVSQDLTFDLADAFDDDSPTTKPPSKDPPKVADKPKSNGDELDLLDAFDLDPPKPTKKPSGDPDPKPNKPVKPSQGGGGGGGGGGGFGLDDLSDAAGGDYKPDKGTGGSQPQNPGYNSDGGGSDPPQEAGSGPIAGIASAIGVALLGAASSYFAYQKKKLCFKIQGGADPESGKGHHGTHSEPQVLSNLLRSS